MSIEDTTPIPHNISQPACIATLTKEDMWRRWLSRLRRHVSGSKGLGNFLATRWMRSLPSRGQRYGVGSHGEAMEKKKHYWFIDHYCQCGSIWFLLQIPSHRVRVTCLAQKIAKDAKGIERTLRLPDAKLHKNIMRPVIRMHPGRFYWETGMNVMRMCIHCHPKKFS